MTPFSWFLLFVSAALLWGARSLYRREAEAWRATLPPVRPLQPARKPRAPAPAPHAAPGRALDQFDWVAPPKALAIPEERRTKLRDRYIAARFPGVLRGAKDLLAVEYVIKVGRHYFEEGQLDDAAELFQLAIEESPGELRLRLAQLEIDFLVRDAAGFTRHARDLRDAVGEVPEWSEIARLGHVIAPREALFEAGGAAAGDGRYGPWPEMPNWIQASWDLTSEVLAADLHYAMASCVACPAHAMRGHDHD